MKLKIARQTSSSGIPSGNKKNVPHHRPMGVLSWLLLAIPICFIAACSEPTPLPTSNLDRPMALTVISEPGAVAGAPEYAYVLGAQRGEVTVIDITAGQMLDLEPGIPTYSGLFLGGIVTDIVATADVKSVYAVDFAGSRLVEICTPFDKDNCTAHKEKRTIGSLPGKPERMAIFGGTAYLTMPLDGKLLVLDLATGASVAEIVLGGSPRDLAVNTDGSRLYVSNSDSNMLSVIDTGAKSVVESIDIGAPTNELALQPGSNAFIYVINQAQPVVEVVDVAQGVKIDLNAADTITENTGIALPSGVPLDVAFVEVADDGDNDPADLQGTVACITSSNGYLYFANTSGDEAHRLADLEPATEQTVGEPVLTVRGVTVFAAEQYPKFQGYVEGGPSGITLAQAKHVVKDETWTLTYEGVLPNSTGKYGLVKAGGLVENTDIDFIKIGVKAGDKFAFAADPTPHGGENCSHLVQYEGGGWPEFKIAAVEQHKLTLDLSTYPAGVPFLETCYPNHVSSSIKADKEWVVFGTVSKYMGRAKENETYSNSRISFTMLSGSEPTLTDTRWYFTVTDGVIERKVSVGNLPLALHISKLNNYIYIADASGDQIVAVDAVQNLAVKIFR